MKKLLFLLLFIQGTFVFGQTKFENQKLVLMNDIFYNTTKDNINSFMKNKGFSKGDIEPGEKDIKEIFSFDSKFDMLEISYSKDDKVSTIVCIYSGAINCAFIEMELKNKGYKAKVVKQSIDGKSINKNIWSISGSKYNFVTYADEEEKIGVLGFGIY